jgi:hypothetical protein
MQLFFLLLSSECTQNNIINTTSGKDLREVQDAKFTAPYHHYVPGSRVMFSSSVIQPQIPIAIVDDIESQTLSSVPNGKTAAHQDNRAVELLRRQVNALKDLSVSMRGHYLECQSILDAIPYMPEISYVACWSRLYRLLRTNDQVLCLAKSFIEGNEHLDNLIMFKQLAKLLEESDGIVVCETNQFSGAASLPNNFDETDSRHNMVLIDFHTRAH